MARQETLRLLNGEPPNADAAHCGPYSEAISSLQEAQVSGGTDAVRRVFDDLVKKWPAMAILTAVEPVPRQTSWTAAELLQTEFPEPRWPVPGILPVGLTALSGRPKTGKSWLAMQISGAVATGGRVLDQEVEPGRVLHLALEDSPRRLKKRLVRQQTPGADGLRFETAWTHLSEGGLVNLQARIEPNDYRLVVIDTLSRALGRADQMDVGEMTALMGNLQQLGQVYDLAILMIDHHRKSSGMLADPIDDILGSTAKAAVVDAVLGLYRQQGKRGATLKVTGRDLEERELALDWDPEYCLWVMLGEAGAVRKDSAQGSILTAISELAAMGEVSSTKNISEHLGRDQGHVSRLLSDLLHQGAVVRGVKQGRVQPYHLPDPSPLEK